MLQLDGQILLWIQEYLRTPWLTKFFTVITRLGDKGSFWILLAILFLLVPKLRKTGIHSLEAMAGSFLINNLFLKNVIARTRPYEAVEGLTRLIEKLSDFSFPSGHTATSFAMAVILYRELPKKYGVCFLVLAGLIALSRLYLGVHYPTDVLAGAISGTLIALAVEKLNERYHMKKELS